MHIINQNIRIFLISLLLAAGLMVACEEEPIDACIDESQVCLTCACPAVFDPVCGCDGVTYGNSCEAGIKGLTSYTAGACE